MRVLSFVFTVSAFCDGRRKIFVNSVSSPTRLIPERQSHAQIDDGALARLLLSTSPAALPTRSGVTARKVGTFKLNSLSQQRRPSNSRMVVKRIARFKDSRPAPSGEKPSSEREKINRLPADGKLNLLQEVWEEVGDASQIPLPEQGEINREINRLLEDGKMNRTEDIKEYNEFKGQLLSDARAISVVATLAILISNGPEAAVPYALGAIGGLGYLWLFNKRIDVVEKEERSLEKTLGRIRFIPLILPFVLTAAYDLNNGLSPRPGSFALIPQEQAFFLIYGVLTQSIPRVIVGFLAVFESLLRMADGSSATGTLGSLTLARKVGEYIKNSQAGADSQVPASTRILALAGDMDSGKSELLASLVTQGDIPCDFPVACTTRPPKASEVNGSQYIFLNDEQFSNMNSEGGLLQVVAAGGYRYAIPKLSIVAVVRSGKLCLLSLDTEHVEELRNDPQMQARTHILHISSNPEDKQWSYQSLLNSLKTVKEAIEDAEYKRTLAALESRGLVR
mmetsp:Transcript_76951/g.120271  ORF Transcript_76951/g.120271 Transcript_76951/m.120271 type:complete len:508 (+) Transcript_76951:30-1553(+)